MLSFVVPVYCEADQIDDALDAFVDCGEDLIAHGAVAAFEVVVVDDGSTDATPERLDARSSDDRIAVVRHDRNRGLGAAIRSGFEASTGSVVVYVDADLPFDLIHISHALDLMANRDVRAVSLFRLSRRGEGSRRFVYSYAYNAFVRWRFGIRLRDVNFAGKFIERDALDGLVLRSEGSFIDVEILAGLQAAGHSVEQFGVAYRPRTRGVSTLSSTATIRTIISEMRRIGPDLPSGRRRPSP